MVSPTATNMLASNIRGSLINIRSLANISINGFNICKVGMSTAISISTMVFIIG